MGKLVELTWRNKLNNYEIQKEVCTLCDDDDMITIGSERVSFSVITEKGEGNTIGFVFGDGDYVIFEDEHGIFGVPSKDVINIKVLDKKGWQVPNYNPVFVFGAILILVIILCFL